MWKRHSKLPPLNVESLVIPVISRTLNVDVSVYSSSRHHKLRTGIFRWRFFFLFFFWETGFCYVFFLFLRRFYFLFFGDDCTNCSGDTVQCKSESGLSGSGWQKINLFGPCADGPVDCCLSANFDFSLFLLQIVDQIIHPPHGIPDVS